MKINLILVTGAVAWFISQLSKAVIYLIINKRFQLDRLVGDDGQWNIGRAQCAIRYGRTEEMLGGLRHPVDREDEVYLHRSNWEK